MFGLQDFWIWLAYLLCILSAALCVVYGIMNWNKDGEAEPEAAEEDAGWAREQDKIEEEL